MRYPWQAGETDFNPEQAVKELGETAELTFRKGTDTSTDENGDTIPAGDIVLTGADVAQASTGGSKDDTTGEDRKSTRLNSSHVKRSRMPSSA